MRSLRSRLLFGLLALVAVISVLTGVITYRRVLAETSTLFDYQLRQMALSLRDQAAIAPEIELPVYSDTTDFIVQIWDLFGRRVYISRPGQPFINRAVIGYADLTLQQQRWRVYSLFTGDGVIQVAQPWSVREQLARDAALRVLVPLLLLLPLMAAATAWIVARAMTPLRRITAEVQRRDAHSLEAVGTAGLPREVRPLVEELNRLLNRLAAAFDGQRAFVADAAHELRSPLTALSLQLQLLERARDEAERDTAKSQLRAAIDRATHLVGQLLALARNEPAGAVAPFMAVPLAQVARQALEDVRPLAQLRHTQLSLDIQAAPAVNGEPDALRMMIRNLIDNAVRYSPEGGDVAVRVGLSPGQALLEIEDHGPGIAPADRARAFARFYRAPGSAEGGSGLGLAIVKAIADRHGAHLSLGDSRPQGLRVSVTFAAVAAVPGAVPEPTAALPPPAAAPAPALPRPPGL